LAPLELRNPLTSVGAADTITLTSLQSGTTTPPTRERLHQALIEGADIVHFHTYGRLARDTAALFLETDDGSVDVFTTEQLVEQLQAVYEAPRFCFLAGCETFTLAWAIVERTEIPAALGMNGLNTIRMTERFTDHFYRRLLYHGIIDVAVAEARASVRDAQDAQIPVLFNRQSASILHAE
jgi:hypothetical protein